nr:hypothetical protein [Tanacetum cinerariifolium]
DGRSTGRHVEGRYRASGSRSATCPGAGALHGAVAHAAAGKHGPDEAGIATAVVEAVGLQDGVAAIEEARVADLQLAAIEYQL